jgi:hypothetical protein
MLTLDSRSKLGIRHVMSNQILTPYTTQFSPMSTFHPTDQIYNSEVVALQRKYSHFVPSLISMAQDSYALASKPSNPTSSV